LDSPALRDLVANYVLRGRRFQLRLGLTPVPEGEWPALFTGVIDNIRYWTDGLGATLTGADVQRFTKKDVFNVLPVLRLLSAVDDTPGQVATLETDSAGLGWTQGPTLVDVKIEQELVKATLSGASITLDLRGQFGTTPAPHAIGRQVQEIIIVQGNPADVARDLLLGGPLVPNSSRNALNLESQWFNAGSFTNASAETGGVLVRFFVDKPIEGKRFIESELFRLIGGYPYVRGDGTYGLKLAEPPLPEETLAVFNDDNVVGLPKVNLNFQRQFNRIVWLYDYNVITNEFESVQIDNDIPSQQRHAAASGGDGIFSKQIATKGIRTTLGGPSFLTDFAQRLFARYAEAPLAFSVDAFVSTFHVEPGDLVLFESTKAIDPRTGTRGIGPLTLEVIARGPDFGSGLISFELLYTPFSGRYGKLAPVLQPSFLDPSTTQAQRDRYVFLSHPISTSDPVQTPTMSDGSPGYKLQ
jgi:hypothetical protein